MGFLVESLSMKAPINKTTSLILFVCLGHFFVDFMLGIWPVFKTMAGLDLAVAGLLAGSCVMVGEGLQAYFGSLSDRGYQRLMLVVGVVAATGAAFLSYFTSYLSFFLLFMCTCLGSAAFHPTAASVLSSLPITNRSSVMGCFTAFGMIGLGISQLVFSHTYDCSNMLALPSVLLAVCLFFFLRGRLGPVAGKERKGTFSLYKKFLKIKELRALYLSMLGNQIILWSLVFLLPDFLQERGYDSWIVFGGGHFFLMAGATIGPPLCGYLADRLSTRQVIVFSSLFTLLFFYLLLLPYTLSFELLFTLLFCLGSMMGSVPPLVWALGAEMVPQHRGVISAFLMGFVWIFSESIGLGFSGYFTTLFSENPVTYALACMGTVQLASCFANRQLPKTVYEVVIA